MLTSYVGSWEDASAAKEQALAQIQRGVDIIFQNADAAGLGIFQAARESKGVSVFGANANQNDVAPDVVIASVVIDLPHAFLLVARSVHDKTFTAHVLRLGSETQVVELVLNPRLSARVRQAPVRDSIRPGPVSRMGGSTLHVSSSSTRRRHPDMTTLVEIASFMDALLHAGTVPDYPQALNGVQVETEANIERIAAAVDVRETTIEGTRACGAQLLLVHHGLFWGGLQPLRGAHFRRVRALMRAGIGLYSSHLPLDCHPDLGNNALLARELGLRPARGFARYQGIDIGVAGEDDVPTKELVRRATAFAGPLGSVVRTNAIRADRLTKRWAICTGAGAGADTLREAAEQGVDTLIVGEGAHWTAIDGEEQGLAIVYAGHYATEVLGVRALAERAAQRFGLPFTFLDAPTGL